MIVTSKVCLCFWDSLKQQLNIQKMHNYITLTLEVHIQTNPGLGDWLNPSKGVVKKMRRSGSQPAALNKELPWPFGILHGFYMVTSSCITWIIMCCRPDVHDHDPWPRSSLAEDFTVAARDFVDGKTTNSWPPDALGVIATKGFLSQWIPPQYQIPSTSHSPELGKHSSSFHLLHQFAVSLHLFWIVCLLALAKNSYCNINTIWGQCCVYLYTRSVNSSDLMFCLTAYKITWN